MCFSASASFSAGAVLTVIGIASIKKTQQPSQIPFASIPFVFGIQQITEGFVWLSLTDPAYAAMQSAATYIFLFIAQIVWPVWVPFSVAILEKKTERKKLERVIVLLGAVVSIYLAYCLLTFHVEARILGKHISYLQEYPQGPKHYGGILYIIATVVPPFFSPLKRMWSLGLSILISYIITTIFYEDYITSVWCFFAAVISVTVLGVMQEVKRSSQKEVVVPAQSS